jgi:hypothetical protein
VAPVACDQALIDAFRAQMEERAERKRTRQSDESLTDADADAIIDELFAEDSEEAESAEDKGAELLPEDSQGASQGSSDAQGKTPTVSYALRRVQELRALMKDAAAVELDDYLLEELERIQKYNLDLVEKKKGG